MWISNGHYGSWSVVYPLMQQIQGNLELFVRQQRNMIQGTLMSHGWTDMRGHH
jgi:hypothetical protein